MLANARVHATLPAQDFERAKRFYADRLGLTPADENPGGAFYECADGTRFFLFPSAGEPSGAHTQLGFRVTDIDGEVAALKQAGVEFEQYDSTDETGIATFGEIRSAWFKDSEGNLLGIVQLPD